MSDELRQRFEDNTDSSDNTENTQQTANTDNPSNTSKPGPDKDPDATRNRTQQPMYLPAEQVEALNDLYDRLDGRSKVNGDGGIEKHADFMECIATFALENEEELAERLGITDE